MNTLPIIRLDTAERRVALAKWIAKREEHDGLTAAEIADASGIYTGDGRADRCFDDLKLFERQGRVERVGRPARWYAVVWEESS